MAIGTKKIFQQDIFGADVLGSDPGHGKIEICVTNLQVPLEDRTVFLQSLESCLREAYIRTAAQLGLADENAVERPQDSGARAGAALRNVLNRFYDKPALTHDEIVAALALQYEAARAACRELHDQAWQELVECDDVDAYKYNCEQALCTSHYANGILAAAEALGIGKDELTEAAMAGEEEREWRNN